MLYYTTKPPKLQHLCEICENRVNSASAMPLLRVLFEGGCGETFFCKKVPPHSLFKTQKRKSGFGLQIRFLRCSEIKRLS